MSQKRGHPRNQATLQTSVLSDHRNFQLSPSFPRSLRPLWRSHVSGNAHLLAMVMLLLPTTCHPQGRPKPAFPDAPSATPSHTPHAKGEHAHANRQPPQRVFLATMEKLWQARRTAPCRDWRNASSGSSSQTKSGQVPTTGWDAPRCLGVNVSHVRIANEHAKGGAGGREHAKDNDYRSRTFRMVCPPFTLPLV